ncbi:hypothetical protein AAHA92_10772 [Salvia divinorum]|uniref:Uncharacterized protein n=1 Tax=Salvia divinorum TaxID=28513 RepID=A0ABD1HXJ1_SALDI
MNTSLGGLWMALQHNTRVISLKPKGSDTVLSYRIVLLKIEEMVSTPNFERIQKVNKAVLFKLAAQKFKVNI